MEELNPRARSDPYGSRLHRDQSIMIATVVPWASIIIASLVPQFFLVSALPLLPPLGFMLLLAWRFVRAGMLPVWAGMPLGLVDDLFSGQPFGFAILTWSLIMLFLEAMETRFPWRNFGQDWFTASLIVLVYILAGAALSGGGLSQPMVIATGPQILISILAFPIVARLVARLDRMRLMRWRVIG